MKVFYISDYYSNKVEYVIRCFDKISKGNKSNSLFVIQAVFFGRDGNKKSVIQSLSTYFGLNAMKFMECEF